MDVSNINIKIELIKAFRALTDLGLVDAKFAVERFMGVYGDNLYSAGYLTAFSRYCGAFTRNLVEVNHETNELIWTAYAVSDKDIRNFGSGSYVLPAHEDV